MSKTDGYRESKEDTLSDSLAKGYPASFYMELQDSAVASRQITPMCHAKSQFGLITQIGVTRVLYHPQFYRGYRGF